MHDTREKQIPIAVFFYIELHTFQYLSLDISNIRISLDYNIIGYTGMIYK